MEVVLQGGWLLAVLQAEVGSDGPLPLIIEALARYGRKGLGGEGVMVKGVKEGSEVRRDLMASSLSLSDQGTRLGTTLQ